MSAVKRVWYRVLAVALVLGFSVDFIVCEFSDRLDNMVVKRLEPFSKTHCWALCAGAYEIDFKAGYFLDPENDSYGSCNQLYKLGAGTLFTCVAFATACRCVDSEAP